MIGNEQKSGGKTMKQKQLAVLIFVFLFLGVRCEAQNDGRKEKISEKSRAAAQKELTTRGIDYTSIDRYFTELENNHLEEVELILQAGAIHPDAKNWSGDAGLHITAEKPELIQIMQLLLDFSADIEIGNKYEQTPLHIAADRKNHPGRRKLVDNGANRSSCFSRNDEKKSIPALF